MTDGEQKAAEAPTADAGAIAEKMTDVVDAAVDDGLVPDTMEFIGSVDDLHLEGHFNTFRIGDKWGGLQPMMSLDLVVRPELDAEGETMANAVVMGVHVGELGNMLKLHAGANHGCTQPEPADRKIELMRILEAAYGAKFDGSERCVVVYMYAYPEGETTAIEG